MPDHRQPASYLGHTADLAFRLIVMQKIAHDLTTLFEVEPQLPPRPQMLARKLDERQERD
jgi:hypothetical protein